MFPCVCACENHTGVCQTQTKRVFSEDRGGVSLMASSPRGTSIASPSVLEWARHAKRGDRNVRSFMGIRSPSGSA